MKLTNRQIRYLVELDKSAVVHVLPPNEELANSLIFRSPKLVERIDQFFFRVRVTDAGKKFCRLLSLKEVAR